MRFLHAVFILALAACGQISGDGQAQNTREVTQMQAHFDLAVRRVAPVAERWCHEHAPLRDCNFQIAIDTRPGLAANASQSYAPNGQPVLTFTSAMIAEARNADELAFIVAHEAAHHIAGHIPRLRLLASTGVDAPDALGLFDAGASFGRPSAEGVARARAKLKDFELEADAVGAQIAAEAGFDPMIAAEILRRMPDPGRHPSGSHPANADRLRAIRLAVADR